MREDQIDQAERQAVLENDRKVREQQQQERGGTYHAYAQSTANDEFGGRFAAIGVPRVVGSTPNPSAQYPAAAAHQRDPVPTEPPLGYSVDQVEPIEPSAASLLPAEQTDAPAGATAAADNLPPGSAHQPDDAGASSSHELGDSAGVYFPGPPDTSCDVDAGSPSTKDE
jgi:hypothetical protein